ncbi:unnamed protein product [Sphagnum jensenii]|uniref:ETFB lysine methyltransferase n=1 Tax=Sphagnum jensenii TaxID=128206 RepID=A0ABP0W2T9_9BRYO
MCLPDPEALNVMLDPGLAFGTGEHPTTRLCLQWLQHVVRPGDQILDYGTGSSILSIAALKMGVDGAVGVDIDPMAITFAKYNASLNNIEPRMFQVLEASGDDNPLTLGKGKFDIVVANILLNSLVQLATCIAAYTKPQGLVGLSSILVDQVCFYCCLQILFLYNQNCVATGQASLMPWSFQESQSVLEFGNLDKEKGIALKPSHCRHFLLWHQLVVEA